MSDSLDEIQAIFFEECAEGLTVVEAGLSAMAAGDVSRDTIASVFRAVHSIKGGSGAFGHAALLAFSHRFENVLDEVRAERLQPEPGVIAVLLSAFDILSDHVAAAQGRASVPVDGPVLAELERVLLGKDEPQRVVVAEPEPESAPVDEFGFEPVAVSIEDFDHPAEAAGWSVRFRPSRAALANGGEPLLVIRELEALGARIVQASWSGLPPLRELDCGDGYMDWTLAIPGEVAESDIRDCFDFVASDSVIHIDRAFAEHDEEPASVLPAAPAIVPVTSSSAPAAEPRAASSNAEMTIRVDLPKLDSLLNLVGELVIRNSILADRLSPADQEKVELPQLSRLTRQIQDSVMSLRAQPIRQAFNRVPRMLRDLAAETGKTVRLEVSGEATEVDKTVIERIGDPLTHMIRNAVDHGIEPADRRAAAGKPRECTILLSAEQKGGRIIVRVADDGGGIDRERVRAKAAQKGLIDPDAVLTNEEIDQLICAPGFSTADTISNISGRGVGMDVVRSNIEALGGRVEIASNPGQGTTFTMILPLTLAILDGMIVRLGGQRYVLPLGSVVESVQPAPGQVQAMAPGHEVIELRGQYLPVRRLTDFFGIRAGARPPEDCLVIVIESDTAGLVGLMVDTVDDRREVVIKSLDRNLHPIRGLGGATVLGDGSIALILDIEAIVAPTPRDRIKGLAA